MVVNKIIYFRTAEDRFTSKIHVERQKKNGENGKITETWYE